MCSLGIACLRYICVLLKKNKNKNGVSVDVLFEVEVPSSFMEPHCPVRRLFLKACIFIALFLSA